MALAAIIATATVGFANAQAEEQESSWRTQWNETETKLVAVKASAEFNTALEALPNKENVLSVPWRIHVLADAANRAGVERVQFALFVYNNTPTANVTGAVQAVARALRNTDGNLIRANQFIEQQNTGKNKVKFTAEELKPPTVFASFAVTPKVQLERALTFFEDEKNGDRLDLAVEGVANALRAIDQDTVRQNAFIEAQREGKPFEIK